MVILLQQLYWSFVKDLFIHSPMNLRRKRCSNLADLLKSVGRNTPPCRFAQICWQKYPPPPTGRDIYTKDLLPARVTILFFYCCKLPYLWMSYFTADVLGRNDIPVVVAFLPKLLGFLGWSVR